MKGYIKVEARLQALYRFCKLTADQADFMGAPPHQMKSTRTSRQGIPGHLEDLATTFAGSSR